ncbi:MAG: ATP-binding protein [Thermodesulfobacteriota bacterium]
MSGHPSAYDLVKSIISISASSLPVDAKLDGMVQAIAEAFGADRCLLLGPEKIVKNGFLSRVASERKPLWKEEGSSFQPMEVTSEEKALFLPSFACIPMGDETSSQGILYLGFSKSRKFSPEEVDLLLVVSTEMGAMVQNAHLHQEAGKTISELAALQEMGKVVTSTLKLEGLLEVIVVAGSRILKAKGGVLRIRDRKTGDLEVRFCLGNYHQSPLDEKIARRVFFTRTSFFLNHFSGEKASFSVLCAPLLSKEGVFGTLAFHDKEGDDSGFTQRDAQLLLIMANQMACSIENALAHHETSRMAREYEKMAAKLSTLWELNKSLLTTVNFERILQMTLTAITLGDGLGFNRAMLFLVNEKDHTLTGRMAVGPDSPEDAGRIWAESSLRKGSSADLIAQLQVAPPENSILNSVVKGIHIPLEQEQCILSRTVLEGRPFNIRFSHSDEGWLQTRCENGCHLGSEVGCYVTERLVRDPSVYAFATVPLWGKGKVIGVILVDNLYNRNPITEDDIQSLSTFSNQAGLAIENAILYRDLEEVHQALKDAQTLLVQREKMAALGELSAAIAHEIKNPLVSIGGFARRLHRAIPDHAPEKRYAQTVVDEVARLEQILNDTLNYTRDESMVFREWDLRDILEESLSMMSGGFHAGGIQLIKQFAEEIPKVNGDDQQLKQVFFNLLTNARQAMEDRGTLFLRVYPFSKNRSSFVRVEVEDGGKGIDPENLPNIFNPFYTTKEKRLGLGLPIVHRIVTSHQGQIEVDNHPGRGVTFIITLPAKVNPVRKDGALTPPIL